MSHEIESFASFREPAWHGLGTVFTEKVDTAGMLAVSGLAGWNVRIEDETLPAGYTSVDPMRLIVRDNPFTGQPEVLGHGRGRYEILSPEDVFSLADGIMEANPESTWETAGSLRGGTQIFGTMSLDRETVLDPTGVADKVETYLLVASSFNGTMAVQAMVTPTRVVCANTLAVALHGATTKFKMRHTQSVNGKVAEARNTLGLVNKYMDKFDELAKALIERTVTDDEFDSIIKKAYPMPEDNDRGQQTKWQTKYDGIWETYRGQYNNTITGTAWGVWNGLTESLDYNRGTRTNANGDTNNETLLMDASGMTDGQNAEKSRLLAIVQGMLANA